MSQKQSKNVERDKPSTKARMRGHYRMGKFFRLLRELKLFNVEHDEMDHKGWKRWVTIHTPPDKRGGPSEH